MYDLFLIGIYNKEDKTRDPSYTNNETIKWINENLEDDVIKVGSIYFLSPKKIICI